jgi:hypothetical protein
MIISTLLLFGSVDISNGENEEYACAFKTKGPQYSTESLFMALIFQQQKMIRGLISKMGSDQRI